MESQIQRRQSVGGRLWDHVEQEMKWRHNMATQTVGELVVVPLLDSAYLYGSEALWAGEVTIS